MKPKYAGYEAKKSGNYLEVPPAGAYIGQIQNVNVEESYDKTHDQIVLMLDVTEGEYKGRYMEVYNDQKVSKFVNHLMYDGKKNTSYEIFYKALDNVKAKAANEEKSALEIWKAALDNITPQVEVKSRRIGGATFQVPTEIRPDRKESISMKNMIQFARKRSGKSMADKLAAEIMDAFNNQGGAFKRKEDMHRMAEANRAFAHFRF